MCGEVNRSSWNAMTHLQGDTFGKPGKKTSGGCLGSASSCKEPDDGDGDDDERRDDGNAPTQVRTTGARLGDLLAVRGRDGLELSDPVFQVVELGRERVHPRLEELFQL